MGKLFGTSGVRGIFGKEITPELFADLGRVIATVLGNSGTVVVGRDPRLSGPVLENALVAGLLSGGCDVALAGMVSTPVLALGTKLVGAKSGAMITASHNPPEYNGLKCWNRDGMAYTPAEEEKIEELYFGRRWRTVGWDEIGTCREIDLLSRYEQVMAERVGFESTLTVVVDCGNGAASVVTPQLLRERGCKVIALNSNPDGLFPARGLEPNEKNLQVLAKTVRELGAGVGLAHDGDADRIGAVDEKGRFVGDKLLALVAAFQVKKPGDVVVTTVDASRVVEDAVEERGGRVVRVRVGDVAVAQAVVEHRAVFGGEPSGSWIFPEVHLAPDGPLAALKVVELLESTGRKLSELVDELPDYVTLREKIACPNERKGEVMRKVEELLPREAKGEISTADGVRVDAESGWVLVRPSGTEPYIRVTAEAEDEAGAKELLRRAAGVVESVVKKK